ncbi:MAG: hypothetical protein BAJALOKI3v1_410040, partial [Promethearchaeota archaeon]
MILLLFNLSFLFNSFVGCPFEGQNLIGGAVRNLVTFCL